ncbi:MAG: hypothetical protein AAF351_01965 [Pseudomonadota bacterium]
MREEFAPQPTVEEKNLGMLKDARDADLASAVRREQAASARKGFPLTPAEAKNQVLERIGTEGLAGILPNYARIRTRIGISHDVDLGDENRPVKVHTVSQFEAPPEATTPDITTLEATIQQAIAAGEDASDSIALLRHLQANL